MFSALIISTGIWLYLIRKYDKYEPESLKVLLFLIIAGGFISTSLAGTFNSIFMDYLGIEFGNFNGSPQKLLSLALFVGFNEEIVKLLTTVVLIKKSKHFDEPIDGIIFALTVSLGFAAFENMGYMKNYGVSVIYTRSFMAIPGHLAFAAFWGYGLSREKYFGKKLLGLNTWKFLMIGALIHALYDYVLFLGGAISLSVFIILIYSVMWGRNKLITMANISPFMNSWICPHCREENSKATRICKKCKKFLRYEKEFLVICPKCKNEKLRGEPCKHCEAEESIEYYI